MIKQLKDKVRNLLKRLNTSGIYNLSIEERVDELEKLKHYYFIIESEIKRLEKKTSNQQNYLITVLEQNHLIKENYTNSTNDKRCKAETDEGLSEEKFNSVLLESDKQKLDALKAILKLYDIRKNFLRCEYLSGLNEVLSSDTIEKALERLNQYLKKLLPNELSKEKRKEIIEGIFSLTETYTEKAKNLEERLSKRDSYLFIDILNQEGNFNLMINETKKDYDEANNDFDRFSSSLSSLEADKEIYEKWISEYTTRNKSLETFLGHSQKPEVDRIKKQIENNSRLLDDYANRRLLLIEHQGVIRDQILSAKNRRDATDALRKKIEKDLNNFLKNSSKENIDYEAYEKDKNKRDLILNILEVLQKCEKQLKYDLIFDIKFLLEAIMNEDLSIIAINLASLSQVRQASEYRELIDMFLSGQISHPKTTPPTQYNLGINSVLERGRCNL